MNRSQKSGGSREFRSPALTPRMCAAVNSFNDHLKVQEKGRSTHFRKSLLHCCDDVSQGKEEYMRCRGEQTEKPVGYFLCSGPCKLI